VPVGRLRLDVRHLCQRPEVARPATAAGPHLEVLLRHECRHLFGSAVAISWLIEMPSRSASSRARSWSEFGRRRLSVLTASLHQIFPANSPRGAGQPDHCGQFTRSACDARSRLPRFRWSVATAISTATARA